MVLTQYIYFDHSELSYIAYIECVHCDQNKCIVLKPYIPGFDLHIDVNRFYNSHFSWNVLMDYMIGQITTLI